MKPARGLGLVLLFIGVCAVAQTISYFNSGFLRQPDAATDRAYLGIDLTGLQPACVNLSNWCLLPTNSFVPATYSIAISNFTIGVSNFAIANSMDVRTNVFNLWRGTNYYTNSVVISNSFQGQLGVPVSRATLRIINTNLESTLNAPLFWHATDLLGGGNLIFHTNKFTIFGNAHLNGGALVATDDAGGSTSAALELRGAPVMIGCDNQNYIAFFTAGAQSAMFDTHGCLQLSGLLGTSGTIFGNGNGGIRATNVIHTTHAYTRAQYGGIISSNSWTHITPVTYAPNNLAPGDTFGYGDVYSVSKNGQPFFITKTNDGTILRLTALPTGQTNQVMTAAGEEAIGVWSGNPSVTNLNVTNINLFPTVSSTIGVINQGAVNWMSTFGTYNLFLGVAGFPAGNFTLSGTDDIGIGRNVMINLTSGNNNVAIGSRALTSLTGGSGNVALGQEAMSSNQTGSDNMAIGTAALQNHKQSFSVGVGVSALVNENATGNTGVGRAAGATITSGNYNTFIGYNAGFNASQKAAAENSMALGNGAYTTNNNQVVIGNSSVTQQVLYGNVIISGNVSAPNGLYYFPQTNGLVGAMTNFTPIHAFGSIMSWGTNVIVTNAATYHPVTNNVTYSTARTNQFGANVAAGILTNLLAGFYYCSIHLSGVAVDNGAWVEGDLLLDSVVRDEISFITVFDPGTPRLKGMSAFGILYIPANTKISFQIKSSGAGGVNVYRAQVSVCSP